MTDLQLGLLVLGAAAVVAVLAYNRVQERAVRREAQRNFASQHADVIAQEPPERREPVLEAPVERFDYAVELAGARLEAVRSAWGELERRFAGRARLAESVAGLRATLQLVSRKGLVSEAELLDFRAQMESLAKAHGAAVSAPEMRAALQAAQALDRACAEVDIQIALHVVGDMQVEPKEGPYTVARRPDGLTFLLDVPRTADVARSFQAMVGEARRLGGSLVDDNGNTLDERALAAIAAELEATRGRFAEMGIEPGSPLALRLFS